MGRLAMLVSLFDRERKLGALPSSANASVASSGGLIMRPKITKKGEKEREGKREQMFVTHWQRFH